MRLAVAATLATLTLASAAHAQKGGYADLSGGHWAATSVAALQARGIVAPAKPGAKFDGGKPITRFELAVTLWKLVQYMERADKHKKTKDGAFAPIDGPGAIRRLRADGYLPASSPICKDGNQGVTEAQLSEALAQVIARSKEKTVRITPDSKKAIPIEHPGHKDGS